MKQEEANTILYKMSKVIDNNQMVRLNSILEEIMTAPTTIATEETTSEETFLSDDIEMQLQMICDNYDIWKLQQIDGSSFSEEDELNSASYAVTSCYIKHSIRISCTMRTERLILLVTKWRQFKR